MTVSDNSGVESIQSKFLGEGELFGLKFNNGYVFCEVEGWTQTKYDPYAGVGTVGPQSGSGFQRLEHDGDDILYIERDNSKVKQVSIGQRPAVIRRYSNYPEDQNRLRSINNLGAPVPGDNYGFIDGEDSPYQQPTEAEELWVTPSQHLNFNFYNPDSVEHNVSIKIALREYNIRTLDPNNNVDRNAIKRIMSPGSPMPVVPAGTKDRQVDFTLRKFWKVDPMPKSEAEKIGRGGN